MARLIDAEEAYKVLTDYYHHKTEIQHKALKEAIERVPTVDAVEVVRCKDCKWASACYGDIVRASKGGGEVHIPLGTDGYCSFAERREDAN